MYYQFYELNHAFLSPARALNDAIRLYYKNPLNPLAHTELGRQIAAAGDLFERVTRRYGKPEFGIGSTVVDGREVAVSERVVWERPFCRLVHFRRERPRSAPRQPNLVIVAPMSGHYATLLRGTVAAMLPHHEVYITDWADARMVPLAMGTFDLDDYVDYVIEISNHFAGDLHMVAVCQPAVPVFAATALMEKRRSASLPRSITLMGGPIDTRENPTEVNLYAAKHDLDWFRRNVIMTVPFPHPGVMRRVYPGFLQLTGFMTMNFDRHLTAHYDYFDDLVKGDGDSAEKHREFYDEYLSVMDLTAEFYLQTVDTVFLRQALPKGEMTHRGVPVEPAAITRTPILTVEGEKDDISGLGQTRAAHRLTPNLPPEKHAHYEQAGVGHYGVFNGSRFRREIAPRIAEFVARWEEIAVADAARPGTADAAPSMSTSAAAAASAAVRGIVSAAGSFATMAPATHPLANETAAIAGRMARQSASGENGGPSPSDGASRQESARRANGQGTASPTRAVWPVPRPVEPEPAPSAAFSRAAERDDADERAAAIGTAGEILAPVVVPPGGAHDERATEDAGAGESEDATAPSERDAAGGSAARVDRPSPPANDDDGTPPPSLSTNS